MAELIARNVGPAGIDIAYERLGLESSPQLLLIMGGGAQMIAWPDGFCAELAARGLGVIRFDNRDAGHSTHMKADAAAYGLEDMAADAVGLLDALGIRSAHVLGMSMGGAIAQEMATEYPERVLSLVSLSSWTGESSSGQHDPRINHIFELPPPATREQAIENAVVVMHAVASPNYPPDEAATRECAGLSFDRDHDPDAPMRQAMAMKAAGDRTEKLVAVRAPTLVLHGAADPMVDVSGGIATAAAIPGARIETIEGMGHDLPRMLWGMLADLIAAHVQRGGEPVGDPEFVEPVAVTEAVSRQ
jgi:pimeloyl-ACP methyl ester carboxylesterase